MSQGLHRLTDVIMKVALLNIYWIVFTVIGLGVFGLFPATLAVFAVVRQWLKGNDEKYFRQFWNYYKKDFLHANAIGYLFVLVGLILYVDKQFISGLDGIGFHIMRYGLLFLLIIFIILLLYIFPVYVHYSVRFFKNFKIAFIVGVTNFFHTIAILLSLILCYFIFTHFPGALVFFGVSLPITCMMYISYTIFTKTEDN